MVHIRHLQKLCDSDDWSDPRVDDIIRNELRTTPSHHRKQWEFALIYLALKDKGKLNPDSRGIAFGAGRERLIFAIANRVGHLLATDLYKPDSYWIGARTNSPKDWLLEAAPFRVDPDRLDAAFMDMTAVSYAPNSVDFCYSSCAFEHIGKEKSAFVKHLTDVARILKDDGIYVLTTELHYGETIESPNNFFFSLPDLLQIVAESDLAADSVFDGRLARSGWNQPSLDATSFGMEVLRQPVITPLRSGRIFTSVQLVLGKRKSDSPSVRVLGFDETKRWLEGHWKKLTLDLWSRWRNVDPYAGMSKTLTGHRGMTIPVPRPGGVAAHTAWLHFGEGAVEVDIAVSASEPLSDVSWSVYERPSNHVPDRTKKAEVKSGGGQARMHFMASHGKIYAIEGRGSVPPSAHVIISARKSSDAAT